TVDNTLALSGGTFSSPSDISIKGNFEWTGGVLNGGGRNLALGGVLITGSADKLLHGRALENNGIASWRGGAVRGGGGAAVINRLGATFKIGDRCFCGAGRFVNAGAFDKIAGLGAARFESSFENTGSVLVQSGRLELAGGGSTTGPFISNLGSSIAITNGYAFRSNSTVGGPGLPMQVSGGAVDVDANVSIKNLDVTGAAMLVHG